MTLRNNDHNKPVNAMAVLLPAFIVLLISAACSTTRRIPDGELLYNGMSIKVNPTDKEKLPSAMLSDITDAVNVKPNNPWPLLSPYRRDPLPIGLWVYNNWNDSARGLKGWLYRKLAKEPVLVSKVRADARLQMMREILDNNGYFGSTASVKIDTMKNPKIASLRYTLDVPRPYLIDSIILLPKTTSQLDSFINAIAKRSKYLVKGERFCVDSLSAERVRIANFLRNRGYYYFRPEYIEFLADSIITPHAIALKLTKAVNIPQLATLRYKTGNVTTTVERLSESRPGVPDTMETDRGTLIVYRPSKLRKHLVPSNITFREGKYFSVRDMDRTQERLSRLGIFGNIQIQPYPADTTESDPRLDVNINCRFDSPVEASLQVNATSKSNSYIGPGLILGISNNNVFGGAERLSLQLNASYEWQTGRGSRSIFNSYEFGLTGSLAFPRLLAPNFLRRTNRDLNWTTIAFGADIMNRPHYFKLADFHAGITYEWHPTRNALNQLTLFKMTYTKLMKTTEEFDEIMNQNPAVALSFQSQYIPELSYTYTLDKFLERERINGINFTATFTEAGNVFDGIYRLCGAKGKKRLFGTPFSQFVKGQAQLVYSRRLIRGTDQWLVSRILIGAAHAYGNSTEVPYSEQFYIGGANCIRAFTVRSLGPGSYRPPHDMVNGYFDQTGTFKLELNSEYRFPIISVLHGAVFVDAGNIWLLKNDPLRPGGQLKAATFLKDIALGTGVGLRVDIGMLVVRGDLGYGLHTPYYNGTNHYFNIAFKKAFAFHLAIGYPF